MVAENEHQNTAVAKWLCPDGLGVGVRFSESLAESCHYSMRNIKKLKVKGDHGME
jgi:hypothetical protein